jgi:hypothetical protein
MLIGMAFDQVLAERIRDGLGDVDGVTDRKMFGGITFMVHGNLARWLRAGVDFASSLPPK